ncbi:MAG: lysoplasmalogenase [Bacteroidota bacterium]|nr:lysoplasmalogenase [Bacteroidota bacterium]
MKSMAYKNLGWSLVYLGTTLLFFFRNNIPFLTNMSYLVGIPVLFAAIVLLCLKGRGAVGIIMALLFSCGGDVAGAQSNTDLQMILFALAHICYIITFLSHAHYSLKGIISTIIFIVMAQVYMFCITYGKFAGGDYATIIYAFVISIMFASAMLYDGSYKLLFVIAAGLFVLSDSMIAWERYIGAFPGIGLMIMIIYYVAQYLFAYGAMNREEANHIVFPQSVKSINQNLVK